MPRTNTLCLLSLTLLMGLLGQLSRVASAQEHTQYVYIPALQRGAFQIRGEIREIHTVANQAGFVAVTYNPGGANSGEVFWFLSFSRNNGAHWERPATLPWEGTDLLNGLANYSFVKTESGLTFLAVVYGYRPSSNTEVADLYLSEDYGSSWTRRPLTVPQVCIESNPRASLRTQQTSGIALYLEVSCSSHVAGSAPKTIYFTSVSNDLGISWQDLPSQPYEDQYVSPSPALGSRLFRFAEANAISYSNDLGVSWTHVGTPPAGVPSLSPVDANRLAIDGLQSGYLSIDSGSSWQAFQNPGCPLSMANYSYTEALGSGHVIGYLICANGVIVSSHDNGQTWSPVASVPTRLGLGSMQLFSDQSDSGQLLAVERGVGGMLWRINVDTSEVTALLDMRPSTWSP